MRDIYVLNLGLLQKILFALDDLFQKILVQNAIIRQVKLYYRGVSDVRDYYSQCSER
mgnify:CR=1 FL=1